MKKKKTLGRKIKGRSAWAAPHGSWGIGELLLQLGSPISSSSLPIVPRFCTALHLESCLPCQGKEKWQQGTLGPHGPWQPCGINRAERACSLPTTPPPSCLLTAGEDVFPIPWQPPSQLPGLRVIGIQTTGQVSLAYRRLEYRISVLSVCGALSLSGNAPILTLFLFPIWKERVSASETLVFSFSFILLCGELNWAFWLPYGDKP